MENREKKWYRAVAPLQEELESWLDEAYPNDAIRVLSGGPGSGKSSFSRIFAAHLSDRDAFNVLYVPLHLIDATKNLAEEIGRFAKAEGILRHNPLDPDSPDPRLFLLFDGLDELASQGKAAAETARDFVREVEKTVELRNHQGTKLQVLICGRELVVQENESEFCHPHQILTLLPYFTKSRRRDPHREEEYHDPSGHLKKDLRQQWWKKYGELTGNGYDGLPKELDREDLDEITAQPLLNYLVALSFIRGKLDFKKALNINAIYEDLIIAVYGRGYEKRRCYAPIKCMKLKDFIRVLEEVGLASWHGDGRSTTVQEIETHCQNSGLQSLLDAFQQGAQAGVTRLLAAFFFRQYGQRPSGDKTFVFTHKSFGEYLTARRIVRAMRRIVVELNRRNDDPDTGWSEKEALKHWAEICGPSAISPCLFEFLKNEIQRQSEESLDAWQKNFVTLFNHVLRHGMPMEQIPLESFKEALFQSHNAEEALLAGLNVCARSTKQVIPIEHPEPDAFGAWLKRIQGQRTGWENPLVMHCLSWLNLSQIQIPISDLYHANLEQTNLIGANLGEAHLEEANLEFAHLGNANFRGANIKGALHEDIHSLKKQLEKIRDEARKESEKEQKRSG